MCLILELFTVFQAVETFKVPESLGGLFVPIICVFWFCLFQFLPLRGLGKVVIPIFKGRGIGGIVPIHITLFITLLILNFEGIIPYFLGITTQICKPLICALWLWIAILLLRISYSLPAYLSHLAPKGAPLGLTPLLVIIERVSLCVRPLTLAIRLAANLTTGHIIFGLMANGPFYLCLLLGIGYLAFELCVCFVQAYIFTLLPALYREEHPWILQK